jgi:hypothetical protein
MGLLGLKRSMVEQGLPAFTKIIDFSIPISQQFKNKPGNWPVVTSKRAQILTYGENYWMVCQHLHDLTIYLIF